MTSRYFLVGLLALVLFPVWMPLFLGALLAGALVGLGKDVCEWV